MPRELRPRKSIQTYTLDDSEKASKKSSRAGPSRLAEEEEEEEDRDSDSDFAFEGDQDEVHELEEGGLEDEVDELESHSDAHGSAQAVLVPPSASPPKSASRTKVPPKKVPNAKTKRAAESAAPRTSKRQALPTPSVHHRHRARPLYTRDGRVERLTAKPKLFQDPSSTLTKFISHNEKVVERVNKAWGYNIGAGPLWDLAEDRGWYKEAEVNVVGQDSESSRRPRVWDGIKVIPGWTILDEGHANTYLPSDSVTTDAGGLKPPPPVICYFGPHNTQERVHLQMFDTYKIGKSIPGSTSHVFNPGAPVWGLDWCPIHPQEREVRSHRQYLAVAPFPSRSHTPEIGHKVKRPASTCIQIWSFGPTMDEAPDISGDVGEVRCEMVLCLDSGAAQDLRWCPLPTHDVAGSDVKPRKLGLLAGTFEDGSLSIFAVPDPTELVTQPRTHPIYVKIPEPLVRIELEDTSCWSLDWANSEIIAVGTTNGVIAVYDIGSALRAETNSATYPITDLLPTHYITVHQAAIRALAWVKAPSHKANGERRLDGDPAVIASGGYDGLECLTDIREGRGTVMNRTRDVINTVTFSTFSGAPITIDHENTIKAYSASPSMLGRGHMFMEPQGPVWSLDTSDYHPQLAVGSADGSCSTTNTLRSTRRGGLVPFLVHKIYQMDYSRKSGEFRMLEQFLPQETRDRTAAASAKTKGKAKGKEKEAMPTTQKAKEPYSNSTGAWSQEVSVQRVRWNSGNGLSGSAMLASATASGLCRIDVLWGRWAKGKLPYGGIEGIRIENLASDAMDVDTELSSEGF